MRTIRLGQPWPLGSSATEQGVNFALVAPMATRVELLLFAAGNAPEPEQVVELDHRHRSGDIWHVEVSGVGIGCCYAYRVFGPLLPGRHGFNPSKLLLDPCARAITGWDVYRRVDAVGAMPNTASCLKGVVTERDRFDFRAAPRPRHSWQRTVIYELHVGGFSRGPGSPVSEAAQGTYLGLIEGIPDLKELGITTVELLPVMAFDPHDAPAGRLNYWGYSPLSWLAPHHAYQQGDDPLQIRHQVRQLVTACHHAGLEVLVDVVYNHTCEGNQAGPTLSWRGIDDRNYYHQNAKGDYLDVSGCGNSIAANRPHSRRLILESMRCWALELGVDGFRFDLGIALSRGEELAPLDHPPLFEEIEADPELADLKLVSEPWDCGGLYRLADFPSRRVGAWNGRFRDDVRRFWKGDEKSCWPMGQRLAGNPDLFGGQPALLGRSINFLTAHDGFTLADLVSYSQKHNLANGEDNRDGDNHNNNWNHGAEGPSTDAAVTTLRNRQLRNLLSSLLLSPGVPMLLMGDEVRRSQGGNNNAWCQNNVLGWMHWQPDADDQALRLFVQRLIHLRHHLADLLNPEIPHPEAGKALRFDQAGHLTRQWDGVKLSQPDWAAWSHTLAWSLNDREHGPLIWCGMNAYHEDLSFEIPSCNSGWKRVIDTHQPSGEDLPAEAPSISGDSVAMGSRSLVLLVAAPLMEGHQL